MREIKFRAWVRRLDKMCNVTGIDFERNEINILRPGWHMSEWFRRDQVELMQYSGLDDVNGKPIYENDIVESNYKYAQPKISQIIMEDGNSYIAGEDLATGNEMLVSDHVDEIEVIGNIHANPELLKGGEIDNPETIEYSNNYVEWIAQESDFIKDDKMGVEK